MTKMIFFYKFTFEFSLSFSRCIEGVTSLGLPTPVSNGNQMCVCHVIRMDSITDTELRPRAEEKVGSCSLIHLFNDSLIHLLFYVLLHRNPVKMAFSWRWSSARHARISKNGPCCGFLWINAIVSKKWRLLVIDFPRKLSTFGVYGETLAHQARAFLRARARVWGALEIKESKKTLQNICLFVSSKVNTALIQRHTTFKLFHWIPATLYYWF